MDINYYKKYEPFFGEYYIKKKLADNPFGPVLMIEREDVSGAYQAALQIHSIPRNKSEVDLLLLKGQDPKAYFDDVAKRLMSEIGILSKFKGHSNIVSLENHKCIKHSDGIGYDILVQMELLTPLDEYLGRRNGKCSENEITKLGIHICKALEAYHEYNLIHKHLSPANIFVSKFGDFKLGGQGDDYLSSEMQGTNYRMAPEGYNYKEYNKSSDIYALGMIMYELLNGYRQPFEKEDYSLNSRLYAMTMRLSGAALPKPKYGSETLKAIVLKACEFYPKDRYQSASEMRHALEMSQQKEMSPTVNERIKTFDGYQIKEVIGRGSYGTVYRLEKTTNEGTRYSALKVIKIPKDKQAIQEIASMRRDPQRYFNEVSRRIAQEVELMLKLSGSGYIVNYQNHKYIQHEDGIGCDILIRMELLTPLLKYLNSIKYSEEDIIKIAIDVCKGLEMCHNNNIIHRDIKLSNIFVSSEGNYKIGDFGVAKISEATASGTTAGSPNYMAPEVYNNKHYGKNIDIYSLGIALYELLNEYRLPFEKKDSEDIYERSNATAIRLSGTKVPPPKYGSAGIKQIVLRATEYDPKRRYHDASEMRRDLEMLQKAKMADATVPLGEREKEQKAKVAEKKEPVVQSRGKRNIKKLVAICGIAFVAIIAGTVFGLYNAGIIGEPQYSIACNYKGDSAEIDMGDKLDLYAQVIPENKAARNVIEELNEAYVEYRINDNDIVKINDEGILTGKAPGETEISIICYSKNYFDITKVIAIKVNAVVDKISNVDDLALIEDETYQLKPKIEPKACKDVLV